MTDPVQKSVLANGLRVVTISLPHLHTGMIAAYVRAGSRHEEPDRNGVSHFLEHLFFRGSEGYPEGRAMNALVEDCGGSPASRCSLARSMETSCALFLSMRTTVSNSAAARM